MYEINESERNYDENPSFLSQLPVGLLEESLRTQFSNPDNFRMDYLSSFINEFQYSKEMVEDPDEDEEIERLKDEFFEFVEKLFMTRLGIGINDFGEMGTEEQFDLLLFTYRFFVLQIKQNYFNLFVNYIEEHKETLVESMPRRKDITSQAFRQRLSEEDTVVLSNLSEIMDTCLDDPNLDIDMFFRLCVGDEPSTEWTIVSDRFEDFTLTGNFLPYYRKMLRPSMRIRIEGEIRNKVLKKYRKDQVSEDI